MVTMKYIIIHIGFLLFYSSAVKAQSKKLTLEEAISTGLKNNFSILISANDRDVAKNNNTLGNAGFLPTIDANSSLIGNNISRENQDFSGAISQTNNTHFNSLNLGLSLNWTLFDGFNMFIQKDKLEALQKLGETSMKATIENILSEIIVSYHLIVQSNTRLGVLQDAINFSNRRKELTMKKYQLGLASELAYLQSITDLNADSSAFLRQQAGLKNAKADLNLLMITDPALDYNVADTILFHNVLDYKELLKGLQSANSQIDISRQNIEIAKMNYRLSHAPNYPQINFFSDYSFNRSKYDYGQTRLTKTYGPDLGISLSYSIFDGFNKRRNSANALIQTETSKYQMQQVTQQMETMIYQLYNDYQNNLKLVKFETENLKITQQNTYIAFEKYRLGELSDIDLRQIQLKQLEADNSLLLAQFQAKQIETELLRLSGKLIEEK
jgi:outer membrane protein